MDKRLHDKLLGDIEALRSIVGECSAETVVGSVAAEFLKWPRDDIDLSSPHRQLYYLLGLCLTTSEPNQPNEFDDVRLSRTKELLETIFNAYAWMFWPTNEEAECLTKEWYSMREVVMPAFLHYFNSGLMASTGQVKARIQRYLVPFDDQVANLFEISVSDMLSIADAIGQKIQSQFDEIDELRHIEEKTRKAFLDEVEKNQWDHATARMKAAESPCKDAVSSYLAALDNLFKIQRSDLSDMFDADTVNVFWRHFSIKRDAKCKLTYPTDSNPAFNHSLYMIDDDTAMVPLPHGVHLALLETVEHTLLQHENRETFLRRRDKELEQEVFDILNRYCGDSATILQSVFETESLQFEHDLVMTWDRKFFVIEAKASPPREPLRDPTKAFVRIRDDFRGDRGIQKAYDQGHRLEERFADGETIYLYDDNGNLAL